VAAAAYLRLDARLQALHGLVLPLERHLGRLGGGRQLILLLFQLVLPCGQRQR